MSEKQRLLCPETIAKIEHPDLIKEVLSGQPFATQPDINYRKVQVGGPMGVAPSGTKVFVLFEDDGPQGDLEKGLILPGIRYVGYTSEPRVFMEYQAHQLSEDTQSQGAVRELGR